MHATAPSRYTTTGAPVSAGPRRVSVGMMILGAVVGYLTITVPIVIAGFALLFVLGPDTLFEPGTYRSTATLESSMLAIGFFSSIAGGFVGALLGKREAIVILLAVVALGGFANSGYSAWKQANRTTPPEPRMSGSVTLELMQQAGENSEKSMTYLFGIPVTGIVGVLAGAALAKRFIRRRG